MADSPGDERTLRSDSEAHHVNVQEAEQIFNELSRALSRHSTKGSEKPAPYDSSQDYHEKDVEKGGLDEGESIDLREYLQSSNDANSSAGIKHKHVGVTWENIEVQVFGGEDQKVRYRGESYAEFRSICVCRDSSFMYRRSEVRNFVVPLCLRLLTLHSAEAIIEFLLLPWTFIWGWISPLINPWLPARFTSFTVRTILHK